MRRFVVPFATRHFLQPQIIVCPQTISPNRHNQTVFWHDKKLITVSSNQKPTATAATMEVLSNGIVPDVIPSKTSFRNGMEPIPIEVTYGSHKVTTGETLTIEQTAKAPAIDFTGMPEDEMHVIIMVDPDAPDRKKATYREWAHWIAKVTPTKTGKHQLTDVLHYNGPTPPKGTGLHRYVFLLFAAKSNTEFTGVPSSDSRGKWDAMKWARVHNLELLGTEYYQVKRD